MDKDLLQQRFSNLKIMESISTLEKRYPVDQWVVGGVHIWPLIRNNFPYFLSRLPANTKEFELKKNNDSIEGFLKIKIDKILSVSKETMKSIAILFKLWKNRKPCDVLLMGDGAGKTKIDSLWMDRFCDPLRIEFQKQGKTALLFEQIESKNTPCLAHYISMQYIEKFSYYLARISTLFYKPKIKLEGYDEFLADLQSYGLDKYFSKSEIIIHVAQIQFCALFFRHILKWYAIQTSYVVCYYGILGYGLALAARDNHINLSDIEHGSIINCPAYCGWSKVPEGGYNILPHNFSLWASLLETIMTKTNISDFHQYHKPVVEGIPFISYFKENSRKFHTQISQIGEIKAQFEKLILVTLQPQFYGANDWEKLADSIKSSPGKWGWIIRSHPAYSDLSGMENILSLNQNNIIFDNANFNLYSVLSQVNCHITTASATALEAMIFKVPTVFISITGQEDFKALIESGVACYAESAKDISLTLHNLLST